MASRREADHEQSKDNRWDTATAVQSSKPAQPSDVQPEANAVDPFIGRVFSHYRLEARLGAGGMGLLYRATDLTLGRTVAVKLLARHLISSDTAKGALSRRRARQARWIIRTSRRSTTSAKSRASSSS